MESAAVSPGSAAIASTFKRQRVRGVKGYSILGELYKKTKAPTSLLRTRANSATSKKKKKFYTKEVKARHEKLRIDPKLLASLKRSDKLKSRTLTHSRFAKKWGPEWTAGAKYKILPTYPNYKSKTLFYSAVGGNTTAAKLAGKNKYYTTINRPHLKRRSITYQRSFDIKGAKPNNAILKVTKTAVDPYGNPVIKAGTAATPGLYGNIDYKTYKKWKRRNLFNTQNYKTLRTELKQHRRNKREQRKQLYAVAKEKGFNRLTDYNRHLRHERNMQRYGEHYVAPERGATRVGGWYNNYLRAGRGKSPRSKVFPITPAPGLHSPVAPPYSPVSPSFHNLGPRPTSARRFAASPLFSVQPGEINSHNRRGYNVRKPYRGLIPKYRNIRSRSMGGTPPTLFSPNDRVHFKSGYVTGDGDSPMKLAPKMAPSAASTSSLSLSPLIRTVKAKRAQTFDSPSSSGKYDFLKANPLHFKKVDADVELKHVGLREHFSPYLETNEIKKNFTLVPKRTRRSSDYNYYFD